MAQIDKPGLYFNTVTYTGTHSSSGAQSITGVGFQPDWVWLKNRTSAGYDNRTYDAVRTATKILNINNTNAEGTDSQGLTAFGTDGFTVGTSNGDNNNGDSYVGWNWKANGSGSANTDGGINSTVSVNNTAGFSIVKYGTGTGSATTVGHGLNAAPNLIIVKPLGTVTTGGWIMGADAIDSTWNNVFTINETGAAANDPSFNDTAPTSSVFSVGNNNTNRSGENYIAYCFVEKKGYSKFGSYVGNNNASGPFVYTGFKPAFVLLKSINNGGWHWRQMDTVRDNNKNDGTNNILSANNNAAEFSNELDIDYLSNGFKIRDARTGINGSAWTVMYMAFAKNPIVGSNNIPATAI
jgi:hypothetical protein